MGTARGNSKRPVRQDFYKHRRCAICRGLWNVCKQKGSARYICPSCEEAMNNEKNDDFGKEES